MKRINFIIAILLILFVVSISFLFFYNDSTLEKKKNIQIKIPQEHFVENFNFDDKFQVSNQFEYISLITTKQQNQVAQTINTKTAGVLNIRCMEENNNSSLFLAQITQIYIDHNDAQYNQELGKALSKPFIFEMNRKGEITKGYFNIDEDDAESIEQLLNLLQVILIDKKIYQISEDTPNGKVLSDYKRDNNKFKKVRKKFLSYKDSEIEEIKISSSTNEFVIDEFWITSLKSEESFATNIMEVDINVQNKMFFSRLDMLDLDSIIWEMNQVDFEKIMKKDNKKSSSTFMEREEDMQDFEKNNYKLETLFKSLSQKVSIKNIDNMVKYFRLHPEDMPQLLDYIKLSKNNRFDAILIQILEMIGTAESQDLIVDIIRSEDFTQSNHLTGIFALNMIENPTKKSIDFLWELYYMRDNYNQEELSNTSILALGNISKSLNEIDQKKIHGKLKDEYMLGGDSDKISSILLAMENAGNVYFKDEIYSGIQSTESDIRASAIAALSKDNTQKTKDVVVTLLEKESTYDVREELAKTVSSINPTDEIMKNVQSKIYSASSNEEIEYIHYLHKYSKLYPENKVILKELRYSKTSSSDAKKLLAKYGYSK